MSPRSVLLAPLLLPLLTFAAGDAAAYTAYVTNEKDNTVSVVDLDKMETIKSIPVGERPRGILLSKDKKYIYICNGDADHIEHDQSRHAPDRAHPGQRARSRALRPRPGRQQALYRQ